MKASVLNYEKLIAAVLYMLKSCKKKKKKKKLKWVNLANQRACPKNKLRQQTLQAKKMTNYLKKVIYMYLKDVKYIVVYLDVCHFNH